MKRFCMGLVCLVCCSLGWGLDSSDLVYRPVFQAKRTFAEMKSERIIRVLTTYNMTNFFVDKGEPRGFEYELLSQYEDFLNKGIKRKDLQLHLVVIPIAFEDLLPSLNAGFGDIVAAGLTITPARKQEVAFSDPYLRDVSEVFVTSRDSSPLRSRADIAGQKVFLRMGTSPDQHLRVFNQGLTSQGLSPLELSYLPKSLEAENALEMVHAGIIDMTVVDDHVAKLWGGVLPKLQIHEDVKLHKGGQLAWAVRKDNPKLLANVNAFIKEHKKGTLLGNIFFQRYFQNTKWIQSPRGKHQQQKIEELRRLFEKYSEQYRFDWLLMAAQGFQESRLEQSTRSHAGAVGIMQLLPSTAKYIGISNIENTENNIHAGIKYMAYLRDRFFNEEEITNTAKVDFTLAAYNAGPNRVNRWRKQAAEQGLDGNRWFGQVEWVALQEIGRETVRYVANINKYYVAYRLMYNWEQIRQAEREGLATP